MERERASGCWRLRSSLSFLCRTGRFFVMDGLVLGLGGPDPTSPKGATGKHWLPAYGKL